MWSRTSYIWHRVTATGASSNWQRLKVPRKADPLFSVGLPRTRRVKSLVVVYSGDVEELIEFADDNRAFYKVEANVKHDAEMNEVQFTNHTIWWIESKEEYERQGT